MVPSHLRVRLLGGVAEEYRQRIYRSLGDGNKAESNQVFERDAIIFPPSIVDPQSSACKTLIGGVTGEYRQRICRLIGDGNKAGSNQMSERNASIFSVLLIWSPVILVILGGVTEEYKQRI